MREQTGKTPQDSSTVPSTDVWAPVPDPSGASGSGQDGFADVVEWAPIGIFRVRRDGSFVAVNKRLAEMLGYATTEDLLARNLEHDVYFDPAQRQTLLLLVESKGTDIRLEARWRTRTGAPIWVELTGHALPGIDGAPGYFEGLAVDVTDRKLTEMALRESERKMSTLISNLPGIAYRCRNDRQWTMEFISDGCRDLTGYTTYDLSFNRVVSYNDLILPEDRETVWTAVQESIEADRPYLIMYRLRAADGKLKWVWEKGEAVKTADGTVEALEGFITDITEKKDLEAQFLRSQRMESIGTLASGIAHDLNNVLAPITMSIAMLRGKITDPSGLKWLQTIDASAVRAAGIVRQVLSFGRGVEGERVPVQPRHIVNEIVKIARETFPRSLTISTAIPKDLWAINADPTQLHQVLLNLSVNARDAMEDGGTLTVTAENVTLDEHYARLHIDARPGRYVALAVADTGTGIPRGILEKIFDPFFTTKPPGRGTGLGLSTVQAIVRGHGGFMNVYTEEGRGSSFRVYLPVCDLEGIAHSRAPQGALPAGRGESVMVVDDEPSIREITRGMLESNGYRVLTASDGAEALALYRIRKREIAAVIIDLMMPGMDGSTAIRALRKMDPGVCIIASSGFGAEATATAAAALGAALFLQKPYSSGTLLRTLDELLHKSTSVN